MSRYRFVLLVILFSVLIGALSTAILQRFQNLFFYNLFLGTFVSFLSSYILFRVSDKNFQIDHLNKVLVGLVSGLITFSFLATIPMTIDRSYSVWMLKSIYESEDRNRILTYSEFETKSVSFFSPNNGQLNRRIEEQLKIGNIEVQRFNKLALTDRGRFITHLNSIIGQIFGLDPEYSRL